MYPQPKSKLRFGVFILVLLVIVMFSARVFSGPFDKGKVLGIKLPQVKFTSSFSFIFESQNLSRIVQQNIAGQKGEYGILIEDLSDAEVYTLKSFNSFPAASLYKLYLLAAVLKEVENGQLRVEDQISSNKSYLTNRLGNVDFGYEEAPATITYTIDEALTRVGRISDNFASLMLVDKIGWDKVQQAANATGAINTQINSPISTTASDIGLFLKKLDKDEVYSQEVSDGVRKYLSLNQISDRIPAKLPEGIEIIHKTGELSKIRHDVGLVKLETHQGKKTYLIVLMSKDLEYEDDGIETMANISKDVYEYFRKKYDKSS